MGRAWRGCAVAGGPVAFRRTDPPRGMLKRVIVLKIRRDLMSMITDEY